MGTRCPKSRLGSQTTSQPNEGGFHISSLDVRCKVGAVARFCARNRLPDPQQSTFWLRHTNRTRNHLRHDTFSILVVYRRVLRVGHDCIPVGERYERHLRSILRYLRWPIVCWTRLNPGQLSTCYPFALARHLRLQLLGLQMAPMDEAFLPPFWWKATCCYHRWGTIWPGDGDLHCFCHYA